MKYGRIVLKLLAAIALAIAAHVFLSYRGGVERSLVRRTTLLGGEIDAVDFIEMARPGQPTTVMARTGFWQLVRPFPGGVDEARVMRLVDALRVTPIDDMLGEQELVRMNRSSAHFALDRPRLKLTAKYGDEAITVSFGALTPSAEGVYAAIEGVKAVFVMPSNILESVDVSADELRRRALFRIGPEMVTGFDLRRDAGSLMRFARKGDKWRMTAPRERVADSEKIRELLTELVGATAVRFVWPTGGTNEVGEVSAALLATYALDPETSLSLTLKCLDGIDRKLAFGGEAEEGLVYALANGGGTIVTVPAALKDLVARGEASSFADMRVFQLPASQVTSFSVTDGDTRYALAAGTDARWHLDAPVVALADSVAVRSLVDRVLALRTADQRADGVAVAVNTNGSPVRVSRAALLGGFRLEDLRAKEILKIDPPSVKRVVTGRGGRTLAAVVYDRDRRAWNVERAAAGGVVDPAAIRSILRALNPLRAEKIERLKASPDDLRRYGLETPVFSVAIDQEREDAVRRNILVGDRAPSGGRYATVGSVDAVFLLDDETCETLSATLVREGGE